MANTGKKVYRFLVRRNKTTGVLTGERKANAVGDPDYIAPVTDLTLCPLPASTTSTTTAATTTSTTTAATTTSATTTAAGTETLLRAYDLNGVGGTWDSILYTAWPDAGPVPANCVRGDAYAISHTENNWNPAVSGAKLAGLKSFFYNIEGLQFTNLTPGNYRVKITTGHPYQTSPQRVQVNGGSVVSVSSPNAGSAYWYKTTIPVTVSGTTITLTDPDAVGAPEGSLKISFVEIYSVS